jgi:hypothetical protein
MLDVSIGRRDRELGRHARSIGAASAQHRHSIGTASAQHRHGMGTAWAENVARCLEAI